MPLVLSAPDHDKWGILVVLLKRSPVCCACAHLSFSPRAITENTSLLVLLRSIPFIVLGIHSSYIRLITTNGVFFLSSREEFSFFMLAHASCSLHARARQRGSSSRPLYNNSSLLCSRAPLILSTHDHDELGLIIVLLRRIPVRCSHPCLS